MAGTVERHIYFIDSGVRKPNTASYNRFLMLVQMAEVNYPTSLLKASSVKASHHKVLKGLLVRLAIIAQYWRVPCSRKGVQNVLFLGSVEPIMTLVAFLISRFKGYKLINERNEFPRPIREDSKVNKLLFNCFIVWWQYRCFDGLFLMTDALVQYYSKYTRCKVELLPMTVDFNRFKDVESVEYKNDYIFYAGSLNEGKDGILTLVKAFGEIKDKSIHLLIAGGHKAQSDYKKVLTLVSKLNLEERVFLLGALERELIPNYLCAAKILVLARPESKQASGGFPTKLGEYLASLTPTIVSNVGEISHYLSDKEVYLVDKGNLKEGVTVALDEILNEYTDYLERAKSAYALAYNRFSVEKNALKFKMLIGML